MNLASMFPQRTDIALHTQLHTQLDRVVGNPPAALRCLLLGSTARSMPALVNAVSLCKHCLMVFAAFDFRFARLGAEQSTASDQATTGYLTSVLTHGKLQWQDFPAAAVRDQRSYRRERRSVHMQTQQSRGCSGRVAVLAATRASSAEHRREVSRSSYISSGGATSG